MATLRQLLERLKRQRTERMPILLPFIIIAVGLGMLAWRSYQLSVRMELGAKMLAEQHANYAADITARRVEAAARAEMASAAEAWQQAERYIAEPNAAILRDWVAKHEWIASAIYVPDFDPASSIFVSEVSPSKKPATTVRGEFYTSTGTVRYNYDPARLLHRVHGAIREQPLPSSKGAGANLAIQQPADITLVLGVKQTGPERLRDGFAFVSPFSAPLQNYGIRAVVRTSYIGSGWENQRVVSLLATGAALVLMAIGLSLFFRGLRKESETMKLRGALIANVSHELRTPLSMIRLGAETLQRAKKLTPKERDEIQESILREVLHLSHLVENVLDVARLQHRQTKALAFTPVHPQELVRSLVHTYESWFRSKGFEVTTDIDEAIGEQMWDRDAVSRALLNLIDNAIKYSSEDRRIGVVLRQTDDHVILEVRDHGIGINTGDLSHIFDPYFRATFSDTQTRRGAGLGLTLVQQIAASHGGRVEVDSEAGQGSTFRLLFPRDLTEQPSVVSGFVQAPEAF